MPHVIYGFNVSSAEEKKIMPVRGGMTHIQFYKASAVRGVGLFGVTIKRHTGQMQLPVTGDAGRA